MKDSDIYTTGAFITGVLSFLGVWIYAMSEWGFLLGIMFGWIPALIVGIIAGLLWPLVALLVTLLVLYLIQI